VDLVSAKMDYKLSIFNPAEEERGVLKIAVFSFANFVDWS
jgi:hypothetical protein